MWTNAELAALSKTISNQDHVKSILTPEEIDVIQENSTRFVNLRPFIMVPKHKRLVIFLIFFLIYFLIYFY